jgi:hypothetical protein
MCFGHKEPLDLSASAVKPTVNAANEANDDTSSLQPSVAKQTGVPDPPKHSRWNPLVPSRKFVSVMDAPYGNITVAYEPHSSNVVHKG